MANLQIKLDDQLRDNARLVAAELGLDLATAVRMFLTQMVRERALPFRPFCDPFHSSSNQAALQASLAQLEAGQTIGKTLAELERISVLAATGQKNLETHQRPAQGHHAGP